MTTKISPALRSLIDALVNDALPDAFDAAAWRDVPLDGEGAEKLAAILDRLHEKTDPPILEAIRKAISATSFAALSEPGAAYFAGAGLEALGVSTEATNGALVRVALHLHPERGGASGVAALVGKNRSSIARVAVGAAIVLDEKAREKLLAHLRNPISHPLPSAAKPGPVASGTTLRPIPHLGNTAQLHLTPTENARVRELGADDPSGISGWLATAIYRYAERPLKSKIPPAPADAVRCTWQTDAEALWLLDKAIGGKTRAPHLRAAVLRALKGSK